MKAFASKKGSRLLCFILCLVFTAFSGVSWALARQCWTRGWYDASPYGAQSTDFVLSNYAVDYVHDCICYAAQYINWCGNITEDVVSGYGGEAIAVLITDEDTGKIVLDTRTSASHRVDMELIEIFDDGGTQEDIERAANGEDSQLSARDSRCWRIQGYVNLPVEPYDGCYTEYLFHEILLAVRPFILPLTVVLVALALTSAAGVVALALLLEPDRRNFFDRVPLEVLVLGLLAALLLAVELQRQLVTTALRNRLGYGLLYEQLVTCGLNPILTALALTTAALLVAWSAARRYKRRELRQSLLVLRLSAVRWFVVLLVASLGTSALWLYRWSYVGWWYTGLPGLTVVLAAATAAVGIWLVRQLKQLEKAARELAAGHFDYQVKTRGLMTGLREQGEALNSIGEGMKTAVDEQLKGERFKTELITNVSHDLKTPLTSIVSYVDLLKKENIPSPTAREYIEVIDRQSAKLKKLTEDLVEASRASSGAIAVHPEPTDVRELLSQSVGEYTERLVQSGVEAVMTLPKHGVVLDTDGRLLWRVLENLMQNIVKYAQRGTRAYFDLTSENGCAVIALKNTSAEALNIPAEELMERFVRGDVSRHTEGSGLGLSIAQSLTQLLGGTMALYLDGDLFKVTLSFEGAREE